MTRPRAAHSTARVAGALLLLLFLIPLTAQIPPHGGSEAYVADLAARRNQVMSTLGPDTILVVWSAPRRVYSTDVEYPYRQASNLLYLSGIEQPETTLVLIPGAKTRRAVVFVRTSSPLEELWSGHVLSPDEITAQSGIDTVIPQQRTEAFDRFIDALLAGDDRGALPGVPAGEFAAFLNAMRQRRARLAVLGRVAEHDVDAGLGSDAEPQMAWARGMAAKYPGLQLVGAGRTLLEQRRIKTPYEQAVLRRSVDISAESHVEAMRVTRPGLWEYQVKATLEYGFLSRGALSWGYPPIVGSGPNATTLHYLSATRRMNAGELLLVDAAGSYQHLTGDITRTWPVSGAFSDEQRAVYDIVLAAQEVGIRSARPGRRVADVVAAIRAAVAEGLTSLGLVRATDGPERDAQIDLWFPHGPIHGIGMDVHEQLETLDPGTAFVLEPGIYVRADAFERMRQDPKLQDYASKVRPIVMRYLAIGIRVEDSFLMTAQGPEMLSAAAPRTAAAIEAVVGRPR